MATLALSLAGQVVGGAFGGPIGATVGRALGALAGAAVDNVLFGEPAAPTPSSDLRLQGSSTGGAIPRLYGWSRLTGNIIWATELERFTGEAAGAKGGAGEEDSGIAASFAVALCEGEVQRLGRIWADGQLLETEGLTIRFHRGSETQGVDSLIEARQGAGAAPAYRGLCYLVFERLPLAAFGNRIPNISVELCRVIGDLEPAIRAVTVIPGATEFGYDPVPRVRVVGPGATEPENTHLSRERADWTLSIDELVALCPNLEHVALVVAWFGDDLRCAACSVAPRVEAAGRQVEDVAWAVAGLTRAGARLVSSHLGAPAYGGTPSDGAVLAAIADLKARGLKVTLYPILLMDVPADNTLPDPRGAAAQPAYPWRGRITADPAPGRPGSPDQSAAMAGQIAAFVGTDHDWRYRHLVLHYARLAVAAGGVDALLVGSELRGLTSLRDASDAFPFVDALVALANDVRAIVGAGTHLTYAADWTEYSGYQPGNGDRFFHLDPLWAAAAIDAVGIDNYMPIADWRDGHDHADAAVRDGPYALAYLRANIAGGEGFDWFYQDEADRLAGVRTPIADGAHGEDWIWRFKDLVGWWSHAHHERRGGVRAAQPTAWVPRSKPIWFTELGCAATDRGANQPNIFGDPKSAEHGRPYFSSGAPDALMQRQFLRAHLEHWQTVAGNPPTGLYGGPMLDIARIFLWTWDARPFPAFPEALEVWRDGRNHATGHWLTGRLGGFGADEVIRAIAADYGLGFAEIAAAPPLVFGHLVETVASARAALTPILAATGLAVHDTAAGLVACRPAPTAAVTVPADRLVQPPDRPAISRRRPDASEELGQLALTYADRGRDYQHGTVTAQRLEGGIASAETTRLVLDAGTARQAGERLLRERLKGRDRLDCGLPPSLLALEAGDVVALHGQGEGPFEITEIRDLAARRLTLRALPPVLNATMTAELPPTRPNTPPARALPLVVAAQLPAIAPAAGSRLLLAARASPWPGHVAVLDSTTGTEMARLGRSAALGELTAPLGAGQAFTWDHAATIALRLHGGHLSGAEPAAVLAGANRLAIATDAGSWEVVAFAEAELLAPGRYRLSRLLRGQQGTRPAMGPASAGNRVLVLDAAAVSVPVPADWLGTTAALRAHAGSSDVTGTALTATLELGPVLPLAPVHLLARRLPASGDISFSWQRCSRLDADSWATQDAPHDSWPERYRLTIRDGAAAIRSIDVGQPAATYGAAEQQADFGGPASGLAYTVAQISPLYGPGHPAAGVFDG